MLGALVPAHDHLQEILRRRRRELAHAEIVDDEQRHGLEEIHHLLSGAVDLRLGELLEENVGLAVEDAVALEDRRHADRLGEVALPGSRSAEKQRRLAPLDEVAGGQLEDEAAVHLAVEVEVEGVESLAAVAELRLLDAALEQAISTPGELVSDEGGEEIEGIEAGGARFEEPGLEHLRHAAQAQLAQGAGKLSEIHRHSPSVGLL